MKSEQVLLLRSMLGFQLCWFALVLLQQQAVLPVLIYLAYGLWQLPNKSRLAVLLTLVIGLAIDSLLLQLNVLQFGEIDTTSGRNRQIVEVYAVKSDLFGNLFHHKMNRFATQN